MNDITRLFVLLYLVCLQGFVIEYHVLKVVNKHTFVITENNIHWEKYTNGGRIKKVKEQVNLSFKSLEDHMETPHITNIDICISSKLSSTSMKKASLSKFIWILNVKISNLQTRKQNTN